MGLVYSGKCSLNSSHMYVIACFTLFPAINMGAMYPWGNVPANDNSLVILMSALTYNYASFLSNKIKKIEVLFNDMFLIT